MTLCAAASPLGLARIGREPGGCRPHVANGWDSGLPQVTSAIGSNPGSNHLLGGEASTTTSSWGEANHARGVADQELAGSPTRSMDRGSATATRCCVRCVSISGSRPAQCMMRGTSMASTTTASRMLSRQRSNSGGIDNERTTATQRREPVLGQGHCRLGIERSAQREARAGAVMSGGLRRRGGGWRRRGRGLPGGRCGRGRRSRRLPRSCPRRR